MKTIKIALSLALGMTAACYAGTSDDLEPEIDQPRNDKFTLSSGDEAEKERRDSSCDKPKVALELDVVAPADPQSHHGNPPPPPPPPNAATEQELIDLCEEQEGIDLRCEEVCEDAGLVFTGQIGIDPGTITYSVSPPQDTGMLCPDGMPEMTTTTTTTADCTCCCAAPPAG